MTYKVESVQIMDMRERMWQFTDRVAKDIDDLATMTQDILKEGEKIVEDIVDERL